ncbi:hypothetical protein [Thermobrachium celere]|uniref:hypothetical protein n=1 Tax=Thermobrachium celere TaxID=53422 RepID=UPI0019404768|nr:hypothetical protein [Thermobrachium celere]GFR36485.1 hypothetical protein TCEA9_22970 [Thermobrachium celere]
MISKLIKNIDIIAILKEFKNNFINREGVKKYLEEYKEDNFEAFSKEFWVNPSIDIIELKDKYKINKKISFSDIIKAYPTKEYLDLLKIYYSTETIKNISLKFNIPQYRIYNLSIPLEIKNIDKYCPECFNNSFNIIRNNKSIDINQQFNFICNNCETIRIYNQLLDKKEVNKIKEEIRINTEKFKYEMQEVERMLKDIFCPICKEQLYLQVNEKDYSYKIVCNKCSYKSISIIETKKEFEKIKSNIDLMENIKKSEEKLLVRILKGKNPYKSIKSLEEHIVKLSNDINGQTYEFIGSVVENNIDLWGELYTNIKKLYRFEKYILYNICKIVKNNGDCIRIKLTNEVYVEYYRYVSKEPIVCDLMEKTNIVILRKILINLMLNKLVIVAEDKNSIYIPKVLIDNISKIEKMLFEYNNLGAIKQLICQRQNYLCYKCGEDGRPFEIAFLSSDKNYNDLNSMIALCDNCYDLITDDGILIDISIAKDFLYLEDTPKSFVFILNIFPDLKNEVTLEQNIREMENKYGTNDVIKAFAITIDKMEKKTDTGYN